MTIQMRTVTMVSAVLSLAVLVSACTADSPTDLPAGTFQSAEALEDRLCLAIQLAEFDYREQSSLRAWWWGQGSGDCSTRTSDVVPTTATIEQRERHTVSRSEAI